MFEVFLPEDEIGRIMTALWNPIPNQHPMVPGIGDR
jgi:hypothetical protein